MMHFVTIKTNSFKSFLQLFDKNEILEDFEFGCTGYPKEGYVDEKIFNGLHRVEDILNFDYDSDWPVIFNAKINKMEIEFIGITYHERYYKVCGEYFKLRILIDKMIELNAFEPEFYIYSDVSQVYE